MSYTVATNLTWYFRNNDLKQPFQENIYISIVLDLSSGTVNRIAWHGVEFNPSLMMMK